jgi:DNA-directed RNA polymerase subunit RPC12/RpoP
MSYPSDPEVPECVSCGGEILPHARAALGYITCKDCGEKESRLVVHTIAPMHKSNYMVFTDLSDLKGINNKGGLVK